MLMIFTLSIVACNSSNDTNVSTNTETQTESTNSTTTQTENSESTESKAKEFTLEELATYNGKDGNKAYIAVDKIVYDVTDSPAWANGGHNGFEAGQDLTDAIKNSPHGTKVLEGLPQVGTLK